MKKLIALLSAALMIAALLTPALAAGKAKDITSTAKVATVVEMYEGKLEIIRSDAQFIAAPSYTNKSSEAGWSAPGTGTRTFNISGADKWTQYFKDGFMDSLKNGIAAFHYDCIWSNITGPMKYSVSIPETGEYEIVVVGAAQIKPENVDKDAQDRGFCLSFDGGEKSQVNVSDTLAIFRDYTYDYSVSSAKGASVLKTSKGQNSQVYQMSYIYNLKFQLGKGTHTLEFWHLEYSGNETLGGNSTRMNLAGFYVQKVPEVKTTAATTKAAAATAAATKAAAASSAKTADVSVVIAAVLVTSAAAVVTIRRRKK